MAKFNPSSMATDETEIPTAVPFSLETYDDSANEEVVEIKLLPPGNYKAFISEVKPVESFGRQQLSTVARVVIPEYLREDFGYETSDETASVSIAAYIKIPNIALVQKKVQETDKFVHSGAAHNREVATMKNFKAALGIETLADAAHGLAETMVIVSVVVKAKTAKYDEKNEISGFLPYEDGLIED